MLYGYTATRVGRQMKLNKSLSFNISNLFRHVFMVRAGGASGSCHVEWAVKLDDIIGTPIIFQGKLVLNVKQV